MQIFLKVIRDFLKIRIYKCKRCVNVQNQCIFIKKLGEDNFIFFYRMSEVEESY